MCNEFYASLNNITVYVQMIVSLSHSPVTSICNLHNNLNCDKCDASQTQGCLPQFSVLKCISHFMSYKETAFFIQHNHRSSHSMHVFRSLTTLLVFCSVSVTNESTIPHYRERATSLPAVATNRQTPSCTFTPQFAIQLRAHRSTLARGLTDHT